MSDVTGDVVPAPLRPALDVLRRAVSDGAFPGAVARVQRGREVLMEVAIGAAALVPGRRPMSPDTVFDLASLTKVVATTTAALLLVQRGALDLGEPVAELLPEFVRGGDRAGENRAGDDPGRDREHRPGVTFEHLLTHTAGLRPWVPLYLDVAAGDAGAAVARACTEPLESVPGSRVAYSDLGFILLGEAISRLTGEPLDRFCAREIFSPLGMNDTAFLLPERLRARCAATETGNRVERGMCGERAGGFSRWRTEVLVGEVNDGNAHYAMGGVSGHAGLFSTAADLGAWAAEWLDAAAGRPARILSTAAARAAIANRTVHLNLDRGLGWAIRGRRLGAQPPSSGGALLPAGAFGHTGFTGTSVWCDPERDLSIILLTNRLHPNARDEIAHVRPRFHDAVVAGVDRLRCAAWNGVGLRGGS